MDEIPEELVQQIKSRRSVSSDGKSVVYDLTDGVDFSKPKDTAQALSAVFMVNEVSHWFTRTGEGLTFTPTCTVEMKFRNTHSEAMKKFFRMTMGDLKNDDLRQLYTSYVVQSQGGVVPNLMVLSGVLGNLNAGSVIRAEDVRNNALLDQMISDIQKNLKITEIDSV